MTLDGRPWLDARAELVAQARRAYPQAADDFDAVCLMASNRGHALRERDAVLNLNADQAQRIARMERALKDRSAA